MPRFSSSTVVFSASLLWMPVCFLANYVQKNFTSELAAGCLTFSFLVLMLMVHLYREKTEHFNRLYYVFAACSFLSVTNLLIGLENDDFIAGFVGFYFNQAEPYLKTAHATLTCYWDGVVHYGMYLTILAAMSWGQSYREVALLWCGSVINSQLVIIPAIVMGRQPISVFPLALHAPLLVIGVLIMTWFLRGHEPNQLQPSSRGTLDKSGSGGDSTLHQTSNIGLIRRPGDVFGLILILATLAVHLFRGTVVFQAVSPYQSLYQNYTQRVEPYLNDPVLFPRIQILLYLFYVSPYLVCCFDALCFSGSRWMLDWSLIFLGAIGQGQFVHIFSALHTRTPYVYRMRSYGTKQILFWVVNILIAITPLYLGLRCHCKQDFYTRPRHAAPPLPPLAQKRRSVVQNPYLRRNSVDKKDS